MPWCASVSSCSKARDRSRKAKTGPRVGMVESRRKASDASSAAGSQQGCSDKRTPGTDIPTSTKGNVLHSKNAGEPVHVPINSHRTRWVAECRVPTV